MPGYSEPFNNWVRKIVGNLLVMYQGVVTIYAASTVVIEKQNGAKYLDSSLEACILYYFKKIGEPGDKAGRKNPV